MGFVPFPIHIFYVLSFCQNNFSMYTSCDGRYTKNAVDIAPVFRAATDLQCKLSVDASQYLADNGTNMTPNIGQVARTFFDRHTTLLPAKVW
jgi:hypothetical protein